MTDANSHLKSFYDLLQSRQDAQKLLSDDRDRAHKMLFDFIGCLSAAELFNLWKSVLNSDFSRVFRDLDILRNAVMHESAAAKNLHTPERREMARMIGQTAPHLVVDYQAENVPLHLWEQFGREYLDMQKAAAAEGRTEEFGSPVFQVWFERISQRRFFLMNNGYPNLRRDQGQ